MDTVINVAGVVHRLPAAGAAAGLLEADSIAILSGQRGVTRFPMLVSHLQQQASNLRSLDDTECFPLGDGVCSEALRNAVEHGNLELSSSLRCADRRRRTSDDAGLLRLGGRAAASGAVLPAAGAGHRPGDPGGGTLHHPRRRDPASTSSCWDRDPTAGGKRGEAVRSRLVPDSHLHG